MHRTGENDAAHAGVVCSVEHAGGGDHVGVGQLFPADFDLVAGFGSEADDNLDSGKGGRQCARIAEVRLRGVGSGGRSQVDAGDVVVASQRRREECADGTADAGDEDLHCRLPTEGRGEWYSE